MMIKRESLILVLLQFMFNLQAGKYDQSILLESCLCTKDSYIVCAGLIV